MVSVFLNSGLHNTLEEVYYRYSVPSRWGVMRALIGEVVLVFWISRLLIMLSNSESEL